MSGGVHAGVEAAAREMARCGRVQQDAALPVGKWNNTPMMHTIRVL